MTDEMDALAAKMKETVDVAWRLAARLAEVTRERDEARRHLGCSEAIENQVERLAKVMAEADGFIWETYPFCIHYRFIDSYTASKFRKYAGAVLSEITATMAEQPKAEEGK